MLGLTWIQTVCKGYRQVTGKGYRCQVRFKADRRAESHVTSSALLDGDTNTVVSVIWFYIWLSLWNFQDYFVSLSYSLLMYKYLRICWNYNVNFVYET